MLWTTKLDKKQIQENLRICCNINFTLNIKFGNCNPSTFTTFRKTSVDVTITEGSSELVSSFCYENNQSLTISYTLGTKAQWTLLR